MREIGVRYELARRSGFESETLPGYFVSDPNFATSLRSG